jgi:heme-degrading monooxygenase HmoA
VIARCWRGWTAAADADAYLDYLRSTGFAEYSATRGNVGSTALRQIRHGRAEFFLISFWSSMDAIGRFAGVERDRAVFYSEDDRFLVSKDLHVNHFSVVHGDLSRLPRND